MKLASFWRWAIHSAFLGIVGNPLRLGGGRVLLCLVTEGKGRGHRQHLAWSLPSVPMFLGNRQEVGLERVVFTDFSIFNDLSQMLRIS